MAKKAKEAKRAFSKEHLANLRAAHARRKGKKPAAAKSSGKRARKDAPPSKGIRMLARSDTAQRGMNPNVRVLKGGFYARVGRFTKVGPDVTVVRNVPPRELKAAWKKYERDRIFFERGGKNKTYRTAGKGAPASR